MYHRWMPEEICRGDILITSEAPFGEILKWNSDEKIVLSQRLFGIRVKQTFDADYIYYYMTSDRFQGEMHARATGTTVIGLRQPELMKCKVRFPKIETQKKISSILRTIDQRIEINEKINNNLSKQIRTLCTAWLIEYAPFGYECPDDWELTPLSSIARFVGGYSYKGEELQESTIAMATIKNFERKGGFKLDGYKELVPSGKLKPEHHAALFDTLVAHTDLTQNADVIGNAEPVLSLSGYEDIIFSMDLVKVLPNTPDISKFLIAAMLQTQQFKSHCLGYVNGTTVLHLSKKALPEYSLILPNDLSLLKPLDEAVTAMYKQMAQNIDENENLANLRDGLLLRLMSGELDVSTVEL
jgi:type I restriction enzyme S subunit